MSKKPRKKTKNCPPKHIVSQILRTIHNFFPTLFSEMLNIEDMRSRSKYSMSEIIMAAVAMFIFKEGSRNALNNNMTEDIFKENYKKMFGLNLPHMDTVHNVLKCLNDEAIEKIKHNMLNSLLEKKSLHKLKYRGEYFTIAVDGTGHSSTDERHCENCLTKKSKNGKVTYMHHVLEAKLVFSNGLCISLATEWVENHKTVFEKQDCEQKAFVRLAKKIKQLHPRLPICILADGLYPNKTFFDICEEYRWKFIVTFQDGNLASVWKKIKQLELDKKLSYQSIEIASKNKTIFQKYKWFNGIDYKGHSLNWIECEESIGESHSSKRFVHLTNFIISEKTVAEISYTGRLRWKIENEGFNDQKNGGYKMTHKYSRKSWNASKNYYQCLQIAHLINQLVELSENIRIFVTGKMTFLHLWKAFKCYLLTGCINREECEDIFTRKIQIRLYAG